MVSATPRQLESLVRLGEALARMRLSPTVESSDVAEALRLMRVRTQPPPRLSLCRPGCLLRALACVSDPLSATLSLAGLSSRMHRMMDAWPAGSLAEC